MEIVETNQLLKKLEQIEPEGLEVSTRMGILSSTKAIYKRKGLFYIFMMEYDFSFEEDIGYIKTEFLEKYKNWYWKVEQTIS